MRSGCTAAAGGRSVAAAEGVGERVDRAVGPHADARLVSSAPQVPTPRPTVYVRQSAGKRLRLSAPVTHAFPSAFEVEAGQ